MAITDAYDKVAAREAVQEIFNIVKQSGHPGNYLYDSGRRPINSFESNFECYDTQLTPVLYRRIGNVVYLSGACRALNTLSPYEEGSTTSVAEYDMFTLPEGYRPKYDAVFLCQGSGSGKWCMVVHTDGRVTCSRYSATTRTYEGMLLSSGYVDIVPNTWMPFSVSYDVDHDSSSETSPLTNTVNGRSGTVLLTGTDIPIRRGSTQSVTDAISESGGGGGSSVVKVIIGDDGTLPSEYPTVRAILDEIRAGRSVVGYWWMSDQHLEGESYVLVYPTEPVLGQLEGLEMTGTFWYGTQRRMVIMSGQGADDTLTISFVDIPSNNKERDSQIVTPSGNVPTTETTIYTHTVTNAGHYLITANACGQYTSTTVDRVLTLSIKVNGTIKAQTISTSASSWYAEGALSINEELSKNDVVTVTVMSSKDSLAVKGVWHAGICQLC